MEKKFRLPMSEQDVRSLHVEDMVLLSGVLYTGRDVVHKYLYEGKTIPVDFRGSAIYHCGPVMVQEDGEWQVRGAGPTTSAREEPYQATIIEKFGIRAVIGKGGMGAKTTAACQKFGCVYLHAVGGAAQVLADCIQKVTGVYMLKEFGSPEAVWELVVKDFPALVTIDAHGHNMHEQLYASTQEKLKKIIEGSV